MSHHYSVPDFRFPQGDARLDSTDLYAFPKPGDTPSRTSSTKPRGAGQRRRIPTSSITIKLDNGGHFAAWEQPELFVQERRSSFKSPR